MKKRKLLPLLLACLLTAGSLSAAYASEPVSEVQTGGILTVAMPSAPGTLNPKDYTSLYEGHVIFQIAQTLILYDESYTDYIPCLATDWSISEDGLDYFFTLRDDVYFSNGRKMTAEDVKYSIEYAATSAKDLVGKDVYRGIDVIDDTHVVIHTSQVFGPYLDYFVNVGTSIIPKEEVEKAGDDWGIKVLVGTGPFKLDENEHRHLLFRRSPHLGGFPQGA